MYDGVSRSEAGLLQRAVGELRVVMKRSGSETMLDELRQVGCLKARFPHPLAPGWKNAVILNTGGGVAGGDRLDIVIEIKARAQATIAAQAAERFYRVRPADPPSQVRTKLVVAAGGMLEWLPQETILFDRCALDRRLEVDLAADTRFVSVETVVFGRAAMGEQVQQGWLRDLVRIRRNGELLLHDAVRLDGNINRAMQRLAVGGGARAMATVIYVGFDAGRKLDAVRVALGSADAGASVWNGMLIARILGADGAMVRKTAIAALEVLRESRPLPRVWLC